MSCKNCNNKQFEVQSIHDVDIDDLATIPDYFIGAREVADPATGTSFITPVRIPGARVMPTGNLANIVALNTNNTALTVPENQVRAGYIDVQPGGNVMRLAGTDHQAMFLMVGDYAEGKMLVQSTGFLTIPAGHAYIPATQYYLGADGEPVTDSAATGQKLFIPLDDVTLMVNGEF